MSYKVFIPTAGTGSRLGGITKYINKSLVSIGNVPTITRIIEMFPKGTKFVIAVGYKGDLVKEYLSLAHPDIEIEIFDVYPYEGEGSGLGLTMLTCKEALQEPFIFCSCDTLVAEDIPAPTFNWMAYDDRDNKSNYRTISVDTKGSVWQINEKGVNLQSSPEPYIGLCGIHNYKEFWNAMESNRAQAINEGEAMGLRQLVPMGIKGIKFTWFDTGITVELEATQKRYQQPDAPNILPKPDESIWLLKNKVIKFSDSETFIDNRIKRAAMLKGFVPQITGYTKHMYAYHYVNGDVMSKCASVPLFTQLLDFSKKFWLEKPLKEQEREEFLSACMKFYRDKTLQRIDLFYSTFEKTDNAMRINDVEYPKLADMLALINWEYVADGLPGQFHGDFHFENILYDKEKNEFCFLDWRQNFGKSLELGDIYYDFAKMLHGLIVCHDLIAKDLYFAKWEDETITYDFERKNILIECENAYYQWLAQNGYDVDKTKLLTALIYLNICGLHEFPYCIMLYALGKELLYKYLKQQNLL